MNETEIKGYLSNDMEDFGINFIEKNNEIDVHEEKPVPKEEVLDLNADDSDLEIVEVHCNINSNQNYTRKKKLLRCINRKIQKNKGNFLQKQQKEPCVKEEIIISDSSDTEYSAPKNKSSKSSYFPKENKKSSLSSIKLNCPKCNTTKTVYSTTLTSTCKECKVNMTFVCSECNNKYDTLLALFRHKKIQCKKVLSPSLQFMQKCSKCQAKHKIFNLNRPRCCPTCNTNMAFECIVCGKEQTSHSVIYSHVKSQCQPRNQGYFCNDCPFKAPSQRSLLLHLSGCHQNLYKLNMNCDKCGKGYANYLSLEQHQTVCGLPYYYCQFCPFRPRLKSNLKRHLLLKHGDQVKGDNIDEMVDRSACPKGFTKDVIESSQENSTDFPLKKLTHVTCFECNSTQTVFYNQSKCFKCAKSLVFPCCYCPTRFRTTTLLYRHTRRMHGKAKHECAICLKTFSFVSDYNEHIKWCGKEPRFACSICSFRTKYRHNLKAHLEKLHNKQRLLHVCSQCGMKYKTDRSLNRHVEVFCKGKPSQRYTI